MASVLGANAYLKVNPADLTSKATQIQNKIEAMNNTLTGMTNAMDVLHENWQSTSGDAYREKAEALISEIRESLDNLGYYVTDLNDAASKYEELESEIHGKVSALDDASNIFNV